MSAFAVAGLIFTVVGVEEPELPHAAAPREIAAMATTPAMRSVRCRTWRFGPVVPLVCSPRIMWASPDRCTAPPSGCQRLSGSPLPYLTFLSETSQGHLRDRLEGPGPCLQFPPDRSTAATSGAAREG